MTYIDILNKWAKYINYDREQKKFNLFSSDYKLHQVGKTIERILKEFDPTGMIAVMYAKLSFKSILKDTKVSAYSVISNTELLNEDREMYECLNSATVTDAENKFIGRLNDIFAKATQGKLIGEGEDNRKEIINCLESVLTDIEKCNEDLFLKGGAIGKIENISTKLHIFNTLAECLLALEKAEDGMYYCFISANDTADCFFSFFIKSNGNILSINDRADEMYIGQHSVSRNGRWTDNKAAGIFPYDYIFNYSGHDYKGYATKYELDENSMDLYSLGIQGFMPIIIAMLLISLKYTGTTPQMPMKHLDSFLPANVEKIESHALMPIGRSELVCRQADIDITYSNEEILKSTPAEEFTQENATNWRERGYFSNRNDFMVELWGEGFAYDPTNLFQKSNVTCLIDKEADEYVPEFVGTEKRMRLQVYKDARQQLANYMRQQMYEEWVRFGKTEAVRKWYVSALLENREYLLRCMYNTYKGINEDEQGNKSVLIRPGIGTKVLYSSEKTVIGMVYDKYPTGYHISEEDGLLGCIKTQSNRGYYYDKLLDETNSKECNLWFVFVPQNWRNLEELTGTEVPKIAKGWNRNGHRASGNSLLDCTDAVEAVGTPFEDYEYNRGLYKNERYVWYEFNFAWGFSKSGWNKFVKEYEKSFR